MGSPACGYTPSSCLLLRGRRLSHLLLSAIYSIEGCAPFDHELGPVAYSLEGVEGAHLAEVVSILLTVCSACPERGACEWRAALQRFSSASRSRGSSGRR